MAQLGLPISYEWFPSPLVMADGMDTAATKMHDVGVPLRAAIPIVINDVRNHFAQQTSPDGAPWAPWAVGGEQGPAGEYTRDYVGGEGILHDSGALESHATSPGSYVVVGNNLEYIPSGIKDEVFSVPGPYNINVWERPFMGLDEEGMNLVQVEFMSWMNNILAFTSAAGLRVGESIVAEPGMTRVSIRGQGGRFVG